MNYQTNFVNAPSGSGPAFAEKLQEHLDLIGANCGTVIAVVPIVKDGATDSLLVVYDSPAEESE